MTATILPLTDLPSRLRTGYGIAVTYRQLYAASVDALIPAKRGHAGCNWGVAENDLPRIAEFFRAKNGARRQRGRRETAA